MTFQNRRDPRTRLSSTNCLAADPQCQAGQSSLSEDRLLRLVFVYEFVKSDGWQESIK